jgi:hypothetical protein
MEDDARFARVIRINVFGGSIMLGLLVLSIGLMAVGFLPSDPGWIAYLLVVGGVPCSLLFLTAWLARRERAEARDAATRRSGEPAGGKVRATDNSPVR